MKTMRNRQTITCILLHALLLSGQAGAASISWSPEDPNREATVTIQVEDARQTGVLHWGVNAEGKDWEQAIPAYRPAGSEMDGVATRTPLGKPTPEGIYTVDLGPFNNPEQVVGTLDFVIEWENGSWDNNGGQDYQVPIRSERIVIEPEYPAFDEPITVRVVRSAPGGELRWGVNAIDGEWQPPHKLYWPEGSIPSDDGLAIDSPLSDPDVEGVSTVEIGPFNRPQQVVTSLHMAVHWDDDWDTDAGRNYNALINLHPAGRETDVSIENPAAGASFRSNMTVAVEAKNAGKVELWLNDIPFVTLLDAPFEANISLDGFDYGPVQLTAHATGENEDALATRRVWHEPKLIIFPVDGGFTPGVSNLPMQTVGFTLHAPAKRFISIMGDFNDWDPNQRMMARFDGGIWWMRVPVGDGPQRYQFVVDGHLRVADPYSLDVDWTDKDGEETHIAEYAKSVVDRNKEPFKWTDEAYERPPIEDLVIYEFFIQDFCPGEGFTGVTARLDYFEELGVNAIEPLPVTEFPGDEGWGYNPAFHMAPESSYGTPDELRELVNEAHKRGIAVIFDMVLNHMDGNAPLHRLYGKNYDDNPYFRKFDGPNWGMPDLDQKNPHTKRYEADVLEHWIKKYHADGYRYDATRWVEWEGSNTWGASWLAHAAKQADPGTYQIAEHLPIEAALLNETPMDASWHAHFRWRLREMISAGELNEEEMKRIMDARTSELRSNYQRVTYTESHDEERIMNELLGAEMTTNEALRRATLALAVTLTAPGVPMIYAGQEFGEDTKKVVGFNPLDWSHMEQPAYRQLWENTKRLIGLRRSHPALTGEDVEWLLLDAGRDVFAYRRDAGDDAVITAGNLSGEAHDIKLSAAAGSSWRNLLEDTTVIANADGATLRLEAGEAVVLIRRQAGE